MEIPKSKIRKSPGKRNNSFSPPIVFLGPSLPYIKAREIIDADFRFPIRRGDLVDIHSGRVVAIIDGVFDQHLSVSPSEIRDALNRGVRIFGASSMGALRAVEVPGVIGMGRVFEMFRKGLIDSDDEVAITFDEKSLRPLCEPLVNVRHAIERLAAPGTISRKLGSSILRAAKKLHYSERLYPKILKVAGVSNREDLSHLSNMLAAYDLKREDAITLLEKLRELKIGKVSSPTALNNKDKNKVVSHRKKNQDLPILLWEFGPAISFLEVVKFMAFTGTLSNYAVKAYQRITLEEPGLRLKATGDPSLEMLEEKLVAVTARAWNWVTDEEVAVTLADLGIELPSLGLLLKQQCQATRNAMTLMRAGSKRFLEALRLELFLDDLALKRETARSLSLKWLSLRGENLGESLSNDEVKGSMEKLCQLLDVRDEPTAIRQLGWWGILPAEVQAFTSQLAFATRLVRGDKAKAPLVRLRKHQWLRPCPKAHNSRRFCTTVSRAYSIVKRLESVVGITRVAMITGLGTLDIPNAQAFRPNGEWSSTVGSGKSESILGAKVGAVMEEIEKWAQEEFAKNSETEKDVVASYKSLSQQNYHLVDPSSLDLPFDSCYKHDLEIAWRRCVNLAGNLSPLIPTAALTHRRLPNDIYYSQQGARKTVTTNGLAAGMSMAEAITHGLCEFVERHARALDFIVSRNPGPPTFQHLKFIDQKSVPGSSRRLICKIQRAGYRLLIRDITSNVCIPTFCATILLPEGSIHGSLFCDCWQRASGWAAHPDPETALNMAIMEASQTILSHIAGAREDLALNARSLGRHERTEACRKAFSLAEIAEDTPQILFSSVKGFLSKNAAADVRWIVNRLQDAGCRQVLIADYSTDQIQPVCVVRAIIPGLETINPYYTGIRARMALLEDVLPRP